MTWTAFSQAVMLLILVAALASALIGRRDTPRGPQGKQGPPGPPGKAGRCMGPCCRDYPHGTTGNSAIVTPRPPTTL